MHIHIHGPHFANSADFLICPILPPCPPRGFLPPALHRTSHAWQLESGPLARIRQGHRSSPLSDVPAFPQNWPPRLATNAAASCELRISLATAPIAVNLEAAAPVLGGAMESGLLTEEQRNLLRSASLGRDGVLEVGSPKHGNGVLKANAGVSKAGDRKSHSGRNGRPKKGGGGGKGTWGTFLDSDGKLEVDRNDPNYDSEEEPYKLVEAPIAQSLEEYKEKVVTIVEEYFVTDDVAEAAANLRDLGSPNYHHHFVKKLISMALDRHDREKEMASVLLSALYADVIQPEQLSKGFMKLLESVDDLSLDIPDASDILALFLARSVVDDILPPAFLSKAQKILPEDSQGVAVIQKADKSYLLAPHHAEIVEKRWGGTTHVTVEEVKRRIIQLLDEYIESGDKAEACRSIRELNVPFFHHEVVKKALTAAIEKRKAEPLILSLLQEAAEEGLITSNQLSKGFTRLLDALDDLALDVPQAKEISQALVAKAIEGGWLSSSFGMDVPPNPSVPSPELDDARRFKQSATTIIQEYFLSDDIAEVVTSLEDLAAPEFHAIFVKKLVTLAMDRKNHEKEMASVLLSALYAEVIPIEQFARGFLMLLESAEDTALDIPDAANQLALFLARAVVDDILAPLYLEEIDEQLEGWWLGREIVHTARAVISARHAGERILRCWGGSTGRVVEDAKDKITKLLEEFEAGGELLEACQCIRDLDMPFFHHEVVKKAVVMAMEKQNDRLLSLLQECSNEGLITTSQMLKGFARVTDTLDDFALDFPAARGKFASYVEEAKKGGWLPSTFSFDTKAANGTVEHVLDAADADTASAEASKASQ